MNTKFDIELYNDDFFLWHKTHAHEYSMKNMQWYVETFHPYSVIDFGCGIASYLEAAFFKGVKILSGLDIARDQALPHMHPEIRVYTHQMDCAAPLPDDFVYKNAFECVLSFETAEHIEPEGSEQFVKNIVEAKALQGRILFTAAPPGQEGTGHINCQPKEYWIDLFEKNGVKNKPDIQQHIAGIWQSQGCPRYIHDNLLIFE